MKSVKKMVGLINNLLGLPYYATKWVITKTYKVLKQIPGYVKKGIDFVIKLIKGLIDTIIKVVKGSISLLLKPFPLIWKIIKKINIKYIFKWIVDVIKESIAQIFTLLGFFIAWFTLTGTAQDIVGIAIIISTVVWLLTIRLRD